jgi:hypothetical protein
MNAATTRTENYVVVDSHNGMARENARYTYTTAEAAQKRANKLGSARFVVIPVQGQS